MKSFYNKIVALILVLTGSFTVSSQCANNNIQYGNISGLSPGQTSTVFCMYGGEYALVSVVSGGSYTFSTCGGSWDTQLTLYSNFGGSSLAYNDDFCGLQSQITWTATFTGQVRVVLDKWPCTSYSSCMNLNVTRGATAADPCQSLITANCNQSFSYSLPSGNGSWNPSSGPYSTPGNEQVFEFTPTISGAHSIQMTHSGGGWSDLFIKSGSCGSSGWNYIDDVLSSATNNVTLNAGTTYYFLIDDENTTASSGSFSISCPTPAANPCNSITALTCGITSGATLGSGNGAWNPPGPWGTPGKEKVFSYTAPASGSYDVAVTTSSAWVDLFYKSSSCGSTGWTYVDDILSSETNTVNLIGGVTYYFLIDDENTTSNSVSINISCPCIAPPGGIDNSIIVTSNTSYASTTIGACDDCSYRSSDDRVLEMEITCAGNYTISTCGGASWDTYLYLSSAPCGGTLLAVNDDNCGLQSSISTFLPVGTYYVTIEGFSSFSQGAFNLDISKSCNLSLSLNPSVLECGYNISCNGSNDGEVASTVSNYCGELTYNWSDGSGNSALSGASAGSYSLFVSDGFGCSANASVVLTEPNALNVSAGNDQTVYYGYTPQSCADLNGSASGGCSEYSYSWTDGGIGIFAGEDINVCPSVSSDYTLTVTDQNGCSATDEVHVCVVDVTCFAGNSQNQKVEVCHTPPGNSGNSHTICINESAVAAHLAHGCSLGACDEQGVCSTASSRMSVSELHEEHLIELLVSPNPFIDRIEVEMFIEEDGVYEIELVNTYGQIIRSVYSGSLISTEQNKFEISTQELGKGIYFLRARSNDSQVVLSKILKM
jgi:hypothetical protein